MPRVRVQKLRPSSTAPATHYLAVASASAAVGAGNTAGNIDACPLGTKHIRPLPQPALCILEICARHRGNAGTSEREGKHYTDGSRRHVRFSHAEKLPRILRLLQVHNECNRPPVSSAPCEVQKKASLVGRHVSLVEIHSIQTIDPGVCCCWLCFATVLVGHHEHRQPAASVSVRAGPLGSGSLHLGTPAGGHAWRRQLLHTLHHCNAHLAAALDDNELMSVLSLHTQAARQKPAWAAALAPLRSNAALGKATLWRHHLPSTDTCVF